MGRDNECGDVFVLPMSGGFGVLSPREGDSVAGLVLAATGEEVAQLVHAVCDLVG